MRVHRMRAIRAPGPGSPSGRARIRLDEHRVLRAVTGRRGRTGTQRAVGTCTMPLKSTGTTMVWTLPAFTPSAIM